MRFHVQSRARLERRVCSLISLRHSILLNLTAKMLTETCKDVRLEPPLNPLSGKVLNETTTKSSDEARVDTAARGFWISGQKAFFDIRVFNLLAKRYRNSKVSNSHRMNKTEKKRQYNERILDVEHGLFMPLVFLLWEEWEENPKCSSKDYLSHSLIPGASNSQSQ